MTTIHEVPGVVLMQWNEECRAVFSEWSSCRITAAEFRTAILEKAVPYAKQHGARAWVVDASKVTTALTQDMQALASQVMKTYAAIGIKYYLVIKTGVSALTNFALDRYLANLDHCGVQLIVVPDQTHAVAWLKSHA